MINKKNEYGIALICTLIVFIFNVNTAYSKTNFTIFKKNISFDLPKDWQTIDKEVGVPLKLLGPLYEGRRPVVLFVPIDLKNEKLSFVDTKLAEENYKLGRLAWLQTFNGKSISFLPMKTYSIDNKSIDIYQFGHLYSFDNSNFEEKSYFVKCKNNLYHLKSLIQVEHVAQWASIVKQITDSFRCE